MAVDNFAEVVGLTKTLYLAITRARDRGTIPVQVHPPHTMTRTNKSIISEQAPVVAQPIRAHMHV